MSAVVETTVKCTVTVIADGLANHNQKESAAARDVHSALPNPPTNFQSRTLMLSSSSAVAFI